ARAPAREGRHRRRADRVLAWGFLLWAPANAVLVESRREASAKLFRDEKPRRGRPEAGFCVGHPRCRRANENPAHAIRPTAVRGSQIPRGPWVGGVGGTPESCIDPPPFIDALQTTKPPL